MLIRVGSAMARRRVAHCSSDWTGTAFMCTPAYTEMRTYPDHLGSVNASLQAEVVDRAVVVDAPAGPADFAGGVDRRGGALGRADAGAGAERQTEQRRTAARDGVRAGEDPGAARLARARHSVLRVAAAGALRIARAVSVAGRGPVAVAAGRLPGAVGRYPGPIGARPRRRTALGSAPARPRAAAPPAPGLFGTG